LLYQPSFIDQHSRLARAWHNFATRL